MHTLYLEKTKYVNQLIFIRYRKYEICRLNRVYFKEGSQQYWQKNINPLLTTTCPTSSLLPEDPLIVHIRPPYRIIPIERKMEEPNNMFEQVKRRKVSVEDKINTKERNNILEKLNRPWNWNGWKLQDASEYLKRDSEIVMAAVKHVGNVLEFASEDL